MRRIVIFVVLLVMFTFTLASAQTEVAEIAAVAEGELEVIGFSLNKGAEIDINAVGLYASRNRQWVAYAWIIDSKTRELVWEMERRRSSRIKDRRSLRKVDDVQFLEAGDYELYFSSIISQNYGWSGGGLLDAIGNLFDGDEEDYERIRRRDLRKCYVRLSSTELNKGDFKRFEPDGGFQKALIRHNKLGDSEYKVTGFELKKPANLRIYAILEFPRSNRSPVDYVWIVNAETRERVWEMDRWDVDHAGGGEKNARFDDEIELDAGRYTLYVVTDGSHSFDEFNVNPPYDPLNWGITVLPGSNFDPGTFQIVDVPQLGKAVVDLTKIRDNDFEEQSFVLERESDLNIYAFGEMSGSNREFSDFGAIVNVLTGETVWEMTYRNTDHAGGAGKNRYCDEIITLEPGTYTAFYSSDGSHSYRDWNSASPFDPDHYGLSIFPAGQTSADQIKLISDKDLKKQSGLLARITRVGDHARKRDRFELKEDALVHIYALGEGRSGQMFDYAYIVDLKSGRDVWEMRYRRTDHAGGASKNRVFDDDVKLKAGEYEVVYESDGSHSFKRWNSRAPRDLINWGVTVSLAE